MKELGINNEFIIAVCVVITTFSILVVGVMWYIKRKSNLSLRERYDADRKMVELEYMRKNMEMQLYDVSRKLEENENRWKDMNHLLISTQNRLVDNPSKSEVEQNSFLRELGLEKDVDFMVDSRQVFVLTPFNDEYRKTFFLIREVCETLKLRCIRGDEEFIPNDIFPVILKQIVKSRLVIANITGRNPNVMYELGVAHAIGKPTIIIAKNFTEIPFDLNNKRMVIFKDDKDLISKLRDSMTDLLLNGVI